MALKYGGSLSPTGKLSTMPAKKRRMERLSFIERLVRIDLGFFNVGLSVPLPDIARMVNRAPRAIEAARRTPDYLRIRTEIQTGINLGNTESIAETAEYRKANFRNMLPDALRVVADTILQKPNNLAERKLQLSAALDLLDREGSFAKISKSEVKASISHDYAMTDGVSAELLALMSAPSQTPALDARVASILDANFSFSNSDTLTHDKQEEALKTLEDFDTANPGVIQ
jgi:hypothetical protein